MERRNDGVTKVQLKVKYLRDIEPIGKIEAGDWIDLRAGEDIFIPVYGYAAVKLGIAIELPKGYEAHIVPRSSTFKRFGVIQTNHMGVIDETYCGDDDEWHFPAYCVRKTTVQNGVPGTIIRKNDRICQFRIMKHQPEIEIVEVNELGNRNRGGMGSTGKR